MRPFGSALFSFVLVACAHDSVRPAMPARGGADSAPGQPSLGYRPAAIGSTESEPALATRFQAAPAILTLEGEASYYSDRLAGHATASGEPYQPLAFTAAHRRLPLGTVLRVTRGDGSRVVYVRVNDRGPYAGKRRILDLSRAAAEALGMLRVGVLEVRAEVVAYGPKRGH